MDHPDEPVDHPDEPLDLAEAEALLAGLTSEELLLVGSASLRLLREEPGAAPAGRWNRLVVATVCCLLLLRGTVRPDDDPDPPPLRLP